MTITATARFDDLGNWWGRVFDFGNGASNQNVLMGQAGNSRDMLFEIHGPGGKSEVRAVNAIVQGETAEWTARVDGSGVMSIFKNGVMLVSGQGRVPDSVGRTSALIGRSNWSNDAPLVGAVTALTVQRWAASDAQIAADAG